MRIVVVRHGIAEAKKGWTGADADRPLVARGRRQAARLHKIVPPTWPDRIISSPALRCRQTVEPLAARIGLPVEISDALATDGGKVAAELCRELLAMGPSGSTVVLCTHRETLEVLLPQLAGDFGGRRRLRPARVGAKGGAWVLHFRGGKLREADYRGPAA
jgi:8-oxo-(d)GTP phosphatase